MKKEIADNLFQYNVEMNGDSIPKNGIVELEDPKAEMVDSRRVSAIATSKIFPDEMMDKAGLTGNFIGHLKMKEAGPTNTNSTDGTVANAIIYQIHNLSPVPFSWEFRMKEKQGCQTNNIESR